MKGRIVDFSVQANSAVISGEEGTRYTFAGSEWNGDTPPTRGMRIDFDVQDINAVAIYKALGGVGSSEAPESKNKMTASLMAIFLGAGINKFYLGYIVPGLVFLLTNTVG